jgi:hypothetical protein
MLDYYTALFAPVQVKALAWSALPDAPVLPERERPARLATRLRRPAARALHGLAARLDPEIGAVQPARRAAAC